jgi:hypothetical protein
VKVVAVLNARIDCMERGLETGGAYHLDRLEKPDITKNQEGLKLRWLGK